MQQRIVLIIVFFIVLLSGIADVMFEEISTKKVIIYVVTIALIIFLWFKPGRNTR